MISLGYNILKCYLIDVSIVVGIDVGSPIDVVVVTNLFAKKYPANSSKTQMLPLEGIRPYVDSDNNIIADNNTCFSKCHTKLKLLRVCKIPSSFGI